MEGAIPVSVAFIQKYNAILTQITELQEENKKLREALENLLDECYEGEGIMPASAFQAITAARAVLNNQK